MGEVYRARDTKLGREVAIKVLPEASAKDEKPFSKWVKALVLLAIFTTAFARATAALGEDSVALRGVSIIDVTTGSVRTDTTLVLAGGSIAALQKSDERISLDDVRTLDLDGKFVIPGLWDMHVHLTDSTEIALPAMVANGVTGVRDMGGDLAKIDRWREEIRVGKRIGPRIVRPGPYVDGDKPGVPFRMSVQSAEDGRQALADLVVLDANPLEYIANTKRIYAVVTRGRYHTRQELDEQLERIKERAAEN